MMQAIRTGSFLAPVRNPQQFVNRAAIVIVGAVAYCVLHTLLTQTPLVPFRSVSWALMAVAPWYVAIEICLRLLGAEDRSLMRRIAVPMVLLGTLIVSTLGERLVLSSGHIDVMAIALHFFQRIPTLALVAIALAFFQARMARSWRNGIDPSGAASSDGSDEFTRALVMGADEIDWVRASGNYVEVYGGGRSYVHRATLREVERALRGCAFIRIHRSTIVKREKIVATGGGRAGWVQMADGSKHQIGPTYRAGLGEALKR